VKIFAKIKKMSLLASYFPIVGNEPRHYFLSLSIGAVSTYQPCNTLKEQKKKWVLLMVPLSPIYVKLLFIVHLKTTASVRANNPASNTQRYLTLIDRGLYIQKPSGPWAILADGAAAH
jgi:hypothetical protein